MVLHHCSKCNTPNIMPDADTHDRCVICLGSNHDMENCEHCFRFSNKGRANRRQTYAVWRLKGGHREAYPSIRALEHMKQQDPEIQKLLGISLRRAPLRRPFLFEGQRPLDYHEGQDDSSWGYPQVRINRGLPACSSAAPGVAPRDAQPSHFPRSNEPGRRHAGAPLSEPITIPSDEDDLCDMPGLPGTLDSRRLPSKASHLGSRSLDPRLPSQGRAGGDRRQSVPLRGRDDLVGTIQYPAVSQQTVYGCPRGDRSAVPQSSASRARSQRGWPTTTPGGPDAQVEDGDWNLAQRLKAAEDLLRSIQQQGQAPVGNRDTLSLGSVSEPSVVQ